MGISFKHELLQDVYNHINKKNYSILTDRQMLEHKIREYNFKNNYTDLLEILKHDLPSNLVGSDDREKLINGLVEYFIRLYRILIQIQNDYVGVYSFKIDNEHFLAIFLQLSEYDDYEYTPPFVYYRIYDKERNFADVKLPKDLRAFLDSLKPYAGMSYEKFEWFKDKITSLSNKYKFKKTIRLMDTNRIEEFLK